MSNTADLIRELEERQLSQDELELRRRECNSMSGYFNGSRFAHHLGAQKEISRNTEDKRHITLQLRCLYCQTDYQIRETTRF